MKFDPPKGIKATKADIGRAVIYKAAPNYIPEYGNITSIGRIGNVFVNYGRGSTNQSTDVHDLYWALS